MASPPTLDAVSFWQIYIAIKTLSQTFQKVPLGNGEQDSHKIGSGFFEKQDHKDRHKIDVHIR